jgi:hypothetical protein
MLAMSTASALIIALFVPPAGSQLFKWLTSVRDGNGCTCCRLVPPDDDVDINRIKLNAAVRSSSVLAGKQSRPGAEERVENNLITVR